MRVCVCLCYEHRIRRLWLRQEIPDALGSIRRTAFADWAVAENRANGTSGEDTSLPPVTALIGHHLNCAPDHLIDWPLEFGAKASLPELPVARITAEAGQTLLVVVERPFLPKSLHMVENEAPLLRVTKHVVAHRLSVLLCDPLITKQALVQLPEAPDYQPVRETRGFFQAARRALPKSARRWPFSGSGIACPNAESGGLSRLYRIGAVLSGEEHAERSKGPPAWKMAGP
jgi:hypothetical protein